MAVLLASEQHHGNVLVLRGPGRPIEVLPGGGLWHPAGLAVSPDGQVVVAETGAGRLALWDPYSSAWSSLGSEGSGEGQLLRPNAVICDDSGMLYVADAGNGRVVRMDSEGGGWAALGSPGRAAPGESAPFSFADPRGLALDGLGRLVVADPGSSRLVRFNVSAFDQGPPGDWEVLDLNADGAPPRPFGVCVLADGLAVADVANRAVHVLDSADTLIHTLDPSRIRLAVPAYVSPLRKDRLIVGDPSANTVQVFRWDGAELVGEDLIEGSDPQLPQPAFQRLAGVCSGRR